MDDSGEGLDVDGISAKTGTWSVRFVLCRTVVDVAVIAARATVCANVMAVGDEGIGSVAAGMDRDANAALKTGTGASSSWLVIRPYTALATWEMFVNSWNLARMCSVWRGRNCGRPPLHAG
jgi:hypothetical protein